MNAAVDVAPPRFDATIYIVGPMFPAVVLTLTIPEPEITEYPVSDESLAVFIVMLTSEDSYTDIADVVDVSAAAESSL